MTIIAYRAGVIAADRRSEVAGAETRLYKLWYDPTSRSVFGSCGYQSHFQLFTRWIESGADHERRPTISDEHFGVIELDHMGRAWVWDNDLVRMSFQAEYMALGSGAQFALGAMANGATAARAAEIACELDANCGCGIDVVEACGEFDYDVCGLCRERIGTTVPPEGGCLVCSWCDEADENLSEETADHDVHGPRREGDEG